MKRFALAIALACVLSGSALAGEIHNVDAPAPGDIHGVDATAPGEMGNGIDDGDMGSGGLAAQALLTILDLVF